MALVPTVTLISPAAVAGRLGISPRTVKRLILRGHLPAHRIGQRWRIDPADVADYLAATRTDGPTAT